MLYSCMLYHRCYTVACSTIDALHLHALMLYRSIIDALPLYNRCSTMQYNFINPLYEKLVCYNSPAAVEKHTTACSLSWMLYICLLYHISYNIDAKHLLYPTLHALPVLPDWWTPCGLCPDGEAVGSGGPGPT